MCETGPLRTKKTKTQRHSSHAARCVDFKEHTISGMTVSAQQSEKADIKASAVLPFSILPHIYFFAHYQNEECDSEWREPRLLSFPNSKFAQRQFTWRTSPSSFRLIPETSSWAFDEKTSPSQSPISKDTRLHIMEKISPLPLL